MLIIKRKVGQRIIVQDPDGNELVIQLIEVRGKDAKIGLSAPSHFEIWPEELSVSASDNEQEVEKDGKKVPTQDGWKGLDYSTPKTENEE